MESQEIIELIKKGKYDMALDGLYQNYPAFKNSYLKSGGNQKDAEDIFQEALLVFIEQLKQPAFELSCSVNTYLFSICRNLSLVHFKKKGKNSTLSLGEDMDYYNEEAAKEIMEREKKYQAMDEVLEKIGRKCLDILKLFYIQNLKMSVIAQKMGFKSETSAKTQKYKCIEKARQLAEPILMKIEKK